MSLFTISWLIEDAFIVLLVYASLRCVFDMSFYGPENKALNAKHINTNHLRRLCLLFMLTAHSFRNGKLLSNVGCFVLTRRKENYLGLKHAIGG